MTEQATIHAYEDPDPEAWGRFITAMHSGDRVEIDREMYYYWLEVLPPVCMRMTLPVGGENRTVHFGFAEGEEPITAFWVESGKYYCQRTALMPGDLDGGSDL